MDLPIIRTSLEIGMSSLFVLCSDLIFYLLVAHYNFPPLSPNAVTHRYRPSLLPTNPHRYSSIQQQDLLAFDGIGGR